METTNYSDTLQILLQKHKNKSALNTQELCKELNISMATLQRRVSESKNLPRFKRCGDGLRARIIFPIVEVARYLSTDLHQVS